jgi:septal ring-binding cell division protein DamX
VSAAPPTTRCHYCGAEVPSDARYCLECGEGLRPYQLLDPKSGVVRTAEDGTTIVERRGGLGGGLVWLALLAVVALGALAAYELTRSDDHPTAATTASTPIITSTVTTSVTATGTTPTTDTVSTAGTDTTVTDTTATDTTATDTTPTDTGTTEPTTSQAARPDDWTGTGYTVIVRSFPKATKSQQDAITYQQGLTGVTGSGVLDSDNFPDLKPGWWVVFVGHYATADAANAAAAKLRDQGQTGAYGRKVK